MPRFVHCYRLSTGGKEVTDKSEARLLKWCRQFKWWRVELHLHSNDRVYCSVFWEGATKMRSVSSGGVTPARARSSALRAAVREER